MVALPKQFEVNDPAVADTGGVVLIPEGQYSGIIVDTQMKPTKKGGQYLELTIVVNQGPYANTELKERLNIVNSNSQAVEIAYKTLARISEAVGMDRTPADSMQLHNIPFMFEAKTELGKPWIDNQGIEREGSDKSYIKKYISKLGGNAGAAPVQQTSPQQQAVTEQPAVGQQATVEAPTANPFAS